MIFGSFGKKKTAKDAESREKERIAKEKKEEEHRRLAEMALGILRKDARVRQDKGESRDRLIRRIFGDGGVQSVGAVSPAANGFAMDAEIGLPFHNDRVSVDSEILDRMGQDNYFIGYPSCAMLMQDWLINSACTVPAEDAMAAGYRVVFEEDSMECPDTAGSNEEQVAKEKSLKIYRDAMRSYGVDAVCVRAEITNRAYGYSLVLPIVDGADYSKPFNLDGIKPGTYKGMMVIEPMWVTPQLGNDGMNPMSGRFYEPDYYYISGNSNLVHYTWVTKLVNSAVPDLLKPVYRFGGIPLTQQIWKRAYAAHRVANEAPNLAMTKRTRCMQGSIETALVSPELVEERMKMLTELSNNYGVLMYDEDMNAPTELDTVLTDFDALIMMQYQLVAAIAKMPVTKLMKVQMQGFGSTGDYELQDYFQSLKNVQRISYEPILRRHLDLYTKSMGIRGAKIGITWNEMDIPNRQVAAEIELTKSQTAAHYIGTGVLTSEEVREKLRNDPEAGYTSIPSVNEDLAEMALKAQMMDVMKLPINGGSGNAGVKSAEESE